MIRVVAHFRPRPGRREEALRILSAFLAPTRLEKGCVFYDLHENSADPDDLTIIEEWESEADLDAHGQSPHLVEGRKKMPEVMEIADVRRYRLLA